MFDPLTAELEDLCRATPSSGTMARLEQLREEPLTSAQRMLVAKAWDRVAGYAQAGFKVAIVDATLPTKGGLPVELAEAELALMLRRTDRSLTHLLGTARAFVTQCPRTFLHWARGDAHYGHVAALADLTTTLTADQARDVDTLVADRAPRMTIANFRALVRRTVASIDPDALGRRHEAAKRRVGVDLRPDADGMAWLRAFLPAPDAIAAMNALNGRADASRTPDDDRTHGQRQVDALLDALESGHAKDDAGDDADVDSDPDRPSTRGRRVLRRRRAEIGVLISWQDLLGLRDGCATLERFGPVPAQMIRDLLSGDDTTCTLRRLVYDELSGELLDYAIQSYAPDARLRDLLRARDVTCRYPGCARPAEACDVEHCTPHDCGGATCVCNCHLFCRRHHNHKTHDGHTYTVDPATGELLWTTALGFTYRQAPTSYDDSGTNPGHTTREVPRLRRHRSPPDDDDPPF